MLHNAPGGVVQHMTEGAREGPPGATSSRSWPAPQVVRRLKWLAALCLIHGVDASCPRGHSLEFPYTCDELWHKQQLTCADLISSGWDCTGCNCPGDSSPPPPASILPPGDSSPPQPPSPRPSHSPPHGACRTRYTLKPVGQQTCDELWAGWRYTCADLASRSNWDCTGCNCPGDSLSSPPPPSPSPPPPSPPPPSPSPPPPPPSPSPASCPNTCARANDGVCDDG